MRMHGRCRLNIRLFLSDATLVYFFMLASASMFVMPSESLHPHLTPSFIERALLAPFLTEDSL